MLWAGIDEAGYGPNLGPLVMSAVVAGSDDAQRPDLWGADGSLTARAGATGDRLWLDDSKRIYRGGKGLDRLEAATLAVLDACGRLGPLPLSLDALIAAACDCSIDAIELTRWLDGREPEPFPSARWLDRAASWLESRPFGRGPWRLLDARAVVLGPAAFGGLLHRGGGKGRVHAHVFGELLRWLWERTAVDGVLNVRCDKHGGRHFYADLLREHLPVADVWIGPEGPALSRYVLTGAGRRLVIEFEPGADSRDGLVALASIVSKTLRERWMSVFNDYWAHRIDGLKPTAGYPTDALRFRQAIEPLSRTLGLDRSLWWREK